MEFTFDENILSDLHKDARGYRPYSIFMEYWDAMSNEEKQHQWNALVEEVEFSISEEKAREAEAVEAFKMLIQTYIVAGAADEKTALRWMSTGEEQFCNAMDVEHFVWKAGILNTQYGANIVKELCKMNGV